jgi:hypothetical protein
MTPDLIQWAITLATAAHQHQARRDPRWSLPYIVHPLRVAALVGAHGGSPSAIAAAILHDVLEDCPGITCGDWPEDIRILVEACTKAPNEDRIHAIERLHRAPIEAVLIKLADRYDNGTAEVDGHSYMRIPTVLVSTGLLIGLAKARGLGDHPLTQALIVLQAKAGASPPLTPLPVT